ncbi:potassium channel subfamily K member 2-like [Hydractinia symbiolongicarpus]|nr:potassium channel subfamily K member 2-like [Hydractinia symbiolongicarpus]
MILSASRIIAKHAFDFVCVLQRKRQTDYEHTKVSTIAYLAFMVGLFLFFYLIGSVLIMKIDKFSYGDALYYSFITLSTIGFGDFYQAEMFESDHLGKQVGMTLFMFFWVLIGLSITASLVIVIASVIKLPTLSKSKVEKKPNNENLIQNDEDQCYI